MAKTAEQHVAELVAEYGTSRDSSFDPSASLRGDLGVESLSLVSLVIRLGDELGVDVSDLGVELAELRTVGDLVKLARAIAEGAPPEARPAS